MNALMPDKLSSRQERAFARRQRIVETAVRLFARQGVAATTTHQIAREAGVAEGLIFHYFPTKLDLVRAVTGSSHTFLGQLREILQDANARPLPEVMGHIAVTWLELLHREADLSSILVAEAQVNPEIGNIVHEVIEEGLAGIAKYLDARVQAGEMSAAVNPEAAAHIYMAAILTFFLQYRDLTESEWEQQSLAFAESLLAAWLRMVAA